MFFQHVCAKKLKKGEKSKKFDAKFSFKMVCLSSHQNAGLVNLIYFVPFYVKMCFNHWKHDFSGNKTLNQHSSANLKKTFLLLNFASNFLLFQLFSVKNIEKASFDQDLECAAPNCWSKYTTDGIKARNKITALIKKCKSMEKSTVEGQRRVLPIALFWMPGFLQAGRKGTLIS